MDLLARLHGIDCRERCEGNCDTRGGEYLGASWPRCPYREITADGPLMAVLELRRQAALNPLSDYPTAYSAGALRIWSEIESAKAEREEETAT